jgi:hypothetical protein
MSGPRRQDHDLETAFAALRSADARSVPSYAVLRDRALAHRARRTHAARAVWSVAAAAAVGALALAAALLAGRNPAIVDLDTEIAMATELSSWSAPTDALYDLASLDIPDSVPGLDVGSGYVPDALGSGDWQTAAATSPVRTDSEVER